MLRIKSLLFILWALSFIPAQTAVTQTQPANAPRQKLSLEPCRLPGWNEDVRCGQYEVYENRQANTGRKIPLRVVVAPWLAEAATRYLPNSRQIVVPHTGHFYGFPCVDELVTTFVAKGTAKELDAACLAQIRRPAFVTEEMLKALANAQMNAQNRTNQAAANEQVWQGVLDVGSAKFRLALRMTQAADGKLTGSLDSPDQQVMGIPIDTISRLEQTLRFEMNLIGASYEGKLNAAGAEIMGEWRQQGRSWTLNFSRAGSGAK